MSLRRESAEGACGVGFETERMSSVGAREIVVQLVRTEFADERNGVPSIDRDMAAEVIRVAQRNKILKPVLKKLETSGVAVPDDLRPEIDTYLRRTMKNNAGALATVREVAKTLGDAGVEHVAFKGPVRQIALNQDVFERPVTDVDILVRKSDFYRATEVLKGIGYRVPSICDSPWWRNYLGEHHLFPNDRRRWAVDLHYRTQQPSCPRPRNQAALLDNPKWIEVGGQPIATFGDVSNFLNTVMSVVKGISNHEPTGHHVIDLARQLHAANDAKRAEFDRAASSQRLVKSYAVARRAVMVMTGMDVGPTPPWFVSDDLLLTMLLTPDNADVRLPQRRHILWHLVDDQTPMARLLNFTREFAWMTAAEITRRTHDVSGQ